MNQVYISSPSHIVLLLVLLVMLCLFILMRLLDEEIEESVIEHSPPEKMMTSFRAESTIENETTVTTYAFTQTTSFRYEQTELDTELSLFLDQLSQEQVDGFNQKIHLDTQISVGYGSYLTELNV